jgi:hypothetical protein
MKSTSFALFLLQPPAWIGARVDGWPAGRWADKTASHNEREVGTPVWLTIVMSLTLDDLYRNRAQILYVWLYLLASAPGLELTHPLQPSCLLRLAGVFGGVDLKLPQR